MDWVFILSYSRQVYDGKPCFVNVSGNLVALTDPDRPMQINFHSFRENRLPFVVKVKDLSVDPTGQLEFTRQPTTEASDDTHGPFCILPIRLPIPKIPTPWWTIRKVLYVLVYEHGWVFIMMKSRYMGLKMMHNRHQPPNFWHVCWICVCVAFPDVELSSWLKMALWIGLIDIDILAIWNSNVNAIYNQPNS